MLLIKGDSLKTKKISNEMPSSSLIYNYSPKTFGVFGNSKELNFRFLDAACEKMRGKKFAWYPGWLYFAARSLTSTIHVYAYSENFDFCNVETAIIVDDGTKENTMDALNVNTWKKIIRLKSEKPVSFIVVKDCKGEKVFPGDVTQDGVVRMLISEGINVSLPFRL